MKVNFVLREQLAPHIYSYYFRPSHHVRYVAGQFIELTLPHDKPDERGTMRWFTLSSSPDQELLAITTRHATTLSSTFKKVLAGLKPGQEVHMSEPMGDFVLPKDTAKQLVFIAGGIGITPFHSMLQWVERKTEQRDIQLVHAAHSQEDLVFTDLFENMDIDFITLVGKKLVAEELIDMVGGLKDKTVYMSGPEPMIEALNKQLIDIGINKTDIVTDYFPNYSEI